MHRVVHSGTIVDSHVTLEAVMAIVSKRVAHKASAAGCHHTTTHSREDSFARDSQKRGAIVDESGEALSTGNECTLVLAPQPAASLPSPVQTQTAASSTSTSLQQIIVKTLNGSLHKFMVLPTDSLLKVKYLIEEVSLHLLASQSDCCPTV
eukprot:1581120-Amphidinium_carterae.1